MLIRNACNDRTLSQSIDNDTPATVDDVKPPAQKTIRKSKKLRQQPPATTLVHPLESTTSEVENNADTVSADTTSMPKVEKKTPLQARSGVDQRNSPKVRLCLRRLGVMLFLFTALKSGAHSRSNQTTVTGEEEVHWQNRPAFFRQAAEFSRHVRND